jgi:hypothetical protein
VFLLFGALSVKLFPVLLLPFAQGLALEFEPMSSTQEAIQQSISHGRVLTEISMPMSDGQLAGCLFTLNFRQGLSSNLHFRQFNGSKNTSRRQAGDAKSLGFD